MKRRRLLAGVASVAAIAGGGRLGSQTLFEGDETDGWTPEVTGADVTLEPGARATVSLQAGDVAGVNLGTAGSSADVSFEFSDAELDPSPSTVFAMRPPTWVWDERTAVAIAVPVLAADDARRGTYEYAVTVYDEFPEDEIEIPTDGERDDSGWDSRTETFSVTVE